MDFIKAVLKLLGITYFVIGLCCVGIRFVKRNGIVGSLVNPYASSDSSFTDVILWPLLLDKLSSKESSESHNNARR